MTDNRFEKGESLGRGVGIRLDRIFGLDLQRSRGIKLVHDHFDELDLRSVSEFALVQEFGEFGLGFDEVRLACLSFDAAKHAEEGRVFPVLDVVVLTFKRKGEKRCLISIR